jgi:uncharacterized protein YndB with AHSA1/START domain
MAAMQAAAGDVIHSMTYVDAPPHVVYESFTVAEAIVRWIGERAVADARPGGEFALDVNGAAVRGSYLEAEPPHRLMLDWGHAGSERLPPASSTVEVVLSDIGGGTLVEIRHSGLPSPERDGYARDWTHYLVRLRIAATGGDPGRDEWPALGATGS